MINAPPKISKKNKKRQAYTSLILLCLLPLKGISERKHEIKNEQHFMIYSLPDDFWGYVNVRISISL